MAKAKFLKDASGNKFYPIAHTSAIYDENGELLSDVLDELANSTPPPLQL